MKDLRARAAETAHRKVLNGLEGCIDALQAVRNNYNDTENLDSVVESRFKEAFNNIQQGLDWLNALKDA